jgi:hypothetical protein
MAPQGLSRVVLACVVLASLLQLAVAQDIR